MKLQPRTSEKSVINPLPAIAAAALCHLVAVFAGCQDIRNRMQPIGYDTGGALAPP
ncbi:MAG: hypothetical protein ACREHD_30450 [Pirellulales bacterium]